MSAPTAASRNSGKLTDGSASGIMDAASVGAVSGTPAAAALSPIGRRESQPAPPPSVANSPGSPVKIVHEPKLILSTRPIYPEIAKRSNIQGTVVVLAELDANGNVVGTKAVSGPIILCHAAVDAVRHWKYEPAVIDGKAGAAQVSISIDFSLKR
jgi:protein TonB